MKRLLCIIALAAAILIPDWASACWPEGGTPAYHQTYYVPTYHVPVYYAPPVYCQPAYPQPLYVQPWPSTPAFPAPRVHPVMPKSDSSRTQPTGTTPQQIAKPEPAAPSRPPQIDPIRPAAGTEVPTPPTKPQVDPAPKEPKRKGLFEIPQNLKPDPQTPTGAPKIEEPKIPSPAIPSPGLPAAPVGEPKLPMFELPKGGSDEKLPPLVLPTEPDTKIPSPTLPKMPSTEPKVSPQELPGGSSAVPVPAPSPDVLTPPDTLKPKKPDALPPLTLPPDTPVAPGASPKTVEARSSPLTSAARELKVSVFPASGVATAGLRKIGFYNHTQYDLQLTLEGKTVTLPARSYLHAHLPPKFTWKCAGQPATSATVPTDATGLDVLIRE